MSAEIIERLPFEKYLELPGDSASALKSIAPPKGSPLLYRSRQTEPRKDTKALKLGRFGHSVLLEPDRALLDCAVWRNDKDGGTRRRYGKDWDAFVAANDGRTIINENEYNDVIAMRDAVRGHKAASALLYGKGRNELSIRWTHERTGRACRSRFDRVIDGCIVDIKTTRDPGRRFKFDVIDFGYLLQAGFYVDAAKAAGLGELGFKIVAVQSVRPFDVVVYSLTAPQIGQGRDEYNAALDLLIECERTNTWPGQAQEEVELDLPQAFDEAAVEAIEWGTEVIQ